MATAEIAADARRRGEVAKEATEGTAAGIRTAAAGVAVAIDSRP